MNEYIVVFFIGREYQDSFQVYAINASEALKTASMGFVAMYGSEYDSAYVCEYETFIREDICFSMKDE